MNINNTHFYQRNNLSFPEILYGESRLCVFYLSLTTIEITWDWGRHTIGVLQKFLSPGSRHTFVKACAIGLFKFVKTYHN